MTRVSSKVSAEMALQMREQAALDELAELGFKTTLHRLPEFVKADPLLGTEDRWVPGEAYSVIYATDGRRRGFSGISAVQVLADARSWLRWQQGLKDDAPNKFVPSIFRENVGSEVVVTQRAAGDTATTAQRRAETERRVIGFESGAPELVNARGAIDANQASQYPQAAS